MEITAKQLSEMTGVSLARVGQLAKEGVIEKNRNGKYEHDNVLRYWKWKEAALESKTNDYSVLLDAEKYREKKRQNDIEEKFVAPIEVLENVLERGVSAMIPILESLPLIMKRHWPEITGDEITLVKRAVAECRNILADLEIKIDE